jgi:hypothetical protein
MTERTDPEVISTRQEPVLPSESVANRDVVVFAPGVEPLDRGFLSFGPGGAVVEVALASRHAASREVADPVASLDGAPLRRGGTAAGGAGGDGEPGRGILGGETPLRPLPALRDLSGDIGDHGTESAQLAGCLRQARQCLQIDVEVDDASRLVLIMR